MGWQGAGGAAGVKPKKNTRKHTTAAKLLRTPLIPENGVGFTVGSRPVEGEDNDEDLKQAWSGNLKIGGATSDCVFLLRRCSETC